MDIEDFIKQYPFLTDMLSAYEEFNKIVTEDEKSRISSFTDKLKDIGGYNKDHANIYENIMRNFWLLFKRYHKNKIYCTYFYQWLDIIKKKRVVSEYMIGIIYQASVNNFVPTGEKNNCPYFSYGTMYKEPINIIKIKNFYDNIQIINKILIEKSDMHELDSQYCYAQRYASECAKIYRNMYNTFCSGNQHSIPENENTCSELRTFNTSYTEYLYKIGDIKNKIPDLLASEKEKHFECSVVESSQTPGQELTHGSRPSLGTGTESDQGLGATPVVNDESVKSLPRNTTAAVATMAGIPPFLALIYKFTPVGTLFRSKNKKSINTFNSLYEEIEKELFYPNHKNAITNSSLETYNVAYGSV